MKVSILALMVCFMLFPIPVTADFDEFAVCDEDGVQKFPDIDGQFVVWQHGTVNEDVGYADLTGVYGSGRLILSGEQEAPVVSHGVVLWYDKTGADRDIAGFDLIAGAGVVLPVDDGIHQRYPKISGSYIICDQYSVNTYNGAVFNGSGYEFISESSATQYDWAIDGSRVVWRQANEGGLEQIFVKDLESEEPAKVIYETTDNQWRPDISGQLVVWEQTDESGDFSLILYDLEQDCIVWSHPVPDRADPAISDGIIVWNDIQAERTDRDIVGYDFYNGRYFNVSTGSADDTLPAISGRTVVWQRNDLDIFGAVISELASLALISPNGGENYLAAGEMEILWQSQGNTSGQIRIDYSVDDSQLWNMIEPNVPDTGIYLWESIAGTDSPLCRIRICLPDDNSVYDNSDEVFTIYQCSPSLTADLTGDCFVGIEDFCEMARQWLDCGNPYDEDCLNGAGQ